MGLALLILGIVLVVFSVQESDAEELMIDEWGNLGDSTIRPEDPGPHWAIGMQKGDFFELNMSASGIVSVRIGIPTIIEETEQEALENIIFDQTKTQFAQRVEINESGTYQVEVSNGGTTAIVVLGNVLAGRILVIYQTFYPYSSPGTLAAIAGLSSLVYGIFSKTRRRH